MGMMARSHDDRGPSIGNNRGLHCASSEPRSCDDRATSVRRLGHDRATIGPRSHDDRATIVHRSGVFILIISAVQSLSSDDDLLDRALLMNPLKIASFLQSRNSNQDWTLLVRPRVAEFLHNMPKNIAISLSRLMKPHGAIRHLDRSHLNPNTRTCLIDDRVDSGPRDLRRPDRIRRLPCVHIACKRKFHRIIVPHGGKRLES